jgi:hypothetical protein
VSAAVAGDRWRRPPAAPARRRVSVLDDLRAEVVPRLAVGIADVLRLGDLQTRVDNGVGGLGQVVGVDGDRLEDDVLRAAE